MTLMNGLKERNTLNDTKFVTDFYIALMPERYNCLK